MRDPKRAQKLRGMVEDLALLTAGTEGSKVIRALIPTGDPFATTAVQRLHEYVGGYPGGGGDGGRGPSNITHVFLELDGTEVELPVPQHSDPVGENIASDRDDKFVEWLREYDALIELAAGALEKLGSITAKVGVSISSPGAERRDDSDDWCASCARVTDHQGRPYMEPSAMNRGSVRRTPAGTKGGRAGAPLCNRCYEWVRGEKCWPPKGLIEAKRDGVRWTSSLIAKATGREPVGVES